MPGSRACVQGIPPTGDIAFGSTRGRWTPGRCVISRQSRSSPASAAAPSSFASHSPRSAARSRPGEQARHQAVHPPQPRGQPDRRRTNTARLPLILPSQPNVSRRLLQSGMAERGLTLNLRVEVDDPSLIRALLRAGSGCSLLSRGAIKTELTSGRLLALPPRPALQWNLALVLDAWAASAHCNRARDSPDLDGKRGLAWPSRSLAPVR